MNQDKEHTCDWVVLKAPKMMQCIKCALTASIDTIIAKTAQKAAQDEKVKLLSRQLFARELRKSAHDAAYALLIQMGKQPAPAASTQELAL